MYPNKQHVETMQHNKYITFCKNVRATPGWKRTHAHKPVPEQGKVLGAMWREQTKKYRASAVLAAKGVYFPVDAGDHFSDAESLKNAAMLNNSSWSHSKSESYKAHVAETMDDELMRRKGFLDWKSNWLNATGADALEVKKRAAKEAVRILGLSYATVVLKGPQQTENFKSNLTKLYELMSHLVKDAVIIPHDYIIERPAGSVQEGGIVKMIIALPKEMMDEEKMILKDAIVSIFRSNDLQITPDKISFMVNGWENMNVMFSKKDNELRRLVGR
tara:strand:+ start:3869 stop:4690 length:822 start_codon:yes stop_codon:yes gene_type:complete